VGCFPSGPASLFSFVNASLIRCLVEIMLLNADLRFYLNQLS
jgi:hypothetical protein